MTPGGLIALLGPFATYVEENRPAGGRRFLDARDHFAAQLVAAWPDIEACLERLAAAEAEAARHTAYLQLVAAQDWAGLIRHFHSEALARRSQP